MPKVLILVAGHPYSGKATLARGLSLALSAGAPVRYAHTPHRATPTERYSAFAQTITRCFEMQPIVVAEAPCSRPEQRVELLALSKRLGARLLYVECTASSAAMESRIHHTFASAATAFLDLRAARARGQRRGYATVGDELPTESVLRLSGERPTTELVAEIIAELERRGVTPPVAKRASAPSPLLVLLVDDDDDLAATLREVLVMLGCRVESAGSGSEALALASRLCDAGEEPDVALLDYNLPDLSGLSLGERLRERWPVIEIVLVTAYDVPWLCDAAFREGICEYLCKPVSAADLIRIVEEARRPEAKMGTF